MLTWHTHTHTHGQGCSAIDFGLSTAALCGCFCMAVIDGWCFLLHAKCHPCTGSVFWLSSMVSQYLSFVRQLLECWWVFGFPLVLDGCVWGIGSQWSTIRSPSHHKGAQALIYECKMKRLYWVNPRKKNIEPPNIYKPPIFRVHDSFRGCINWCINRGTLPAGDDDDDAGGAGGFVPKWSHIVSGQMDTCDMLKQRLSGVPSTYKYMWCTWFTCISHTSIISLMFYSYVHMTPWDGWYIHHTSTNSYMIMPLGSTRPLDSAGYFQFHLQENPPKS